MHTTGNANSNLPPPAPTHRNHVLEYDFPFNLLVAEPVTRAQRRTLPKAQKACDDEWGKLLRRETWDPSSVQEWDFICQRSKKSGVRVHVARIFEICVVKGAELSDSDPRKKYKGRAVLDGS